MNFSLQYLTIQQKGFIMNSLSLIFAICGAIVGAIVWAFISVGTGHELGYIAWGVGGLVGFAGSLGGGKGFSCGITCGILALVSIFGGKMMAVYYMAPDELRPMIEESYSIQSYNDCVQQSVELAKLISENQYPKFMVKHGYTQTEDPKDVSDDELYDFKFHIIPSIKRVDEGRLSYQEWKDEGIKLTLEDIMAELPLHEIVIDDLNFIDIIFAVLGLLTAYRLGQGGETYSIN